MIVMPIFTPTVVYAAVGIFYFLVVLDVVVQAATGIWQAVFPIAAPMLALGTGRALRCWARQRARIHQRMCDFQVQECTCFCEDDRPLVYNNIASLMRDTGKVNDEATVDHCLEVFNKMVRERLPVALIASVGPGSLRYLHALSIFLFTTNVRRV